MDRIPFHVPDIDESDVEAVTEVLRSRWLTTGDRCRRFEAEFARLLDPDGDLQALAVSSGTAAMHLALEAAGIGPGDRVIVPVMTFTATAEVVRYLGADPLFVDVGPEDANLRVEDVRRVLDSLPATVTGAVRAVMPVHYAGRACDMVGLCALAEESGWRVVDDAAHALPASSGGRMVGGLGDATAFSFYATKSICTGEGGMVVTGDPELARRMRVMRLHGISRDAFDRYRSSAPAWEYEVVAPGFKYNLSDVAAALGLTQLARLEATTKRREAVAAGYAERLAGREDLLLPARTPAPDRHAWHLYPVRVRGGRDRRDQVIERMAAAGVGTSVHFIPLHRMPYWRDRYELSPARFPVAEDIFSGQISLPIYPGLTDAGLDRVAETLLDALDRTA